MKLKELFEQMDTRLRVPQTRYVSMYYGCCRGHAESLDRSGFRPSVVGRKTLTLVSTPEMAKTMAKFRDCDAIVEVKRIPANYLQVDYKATNAPSDIWEAIERINEGEDVSLKLFKLLDGGSFTYINKLRKK